MNRALLDVSDGLEWVYWDDYGRMLCTSDCKHFQYDGKGKLITSIIDKLNCNTKGKDTGREDKHGNKIFSGDICEVIINYHDTKYNLVVEFDDCSFGLYDKFNNKHCGLGDTRFESIIRIGNIHKNADLLEGAE